MTLSYRSLKMQLAALTAILALSLPVLAESNTLEVKCIDQAGNPAAGVKVVIRHLNSVKDKDKKSDPKGIAAFSKIDDGIYRVVGRRDGSAPAFYEFAVLKGGATQSVTLRFEPGSPDQKLYFEDTALSQKADALLAQGVQALQGGKFADAEKAIAEAVSINPSNPDGQYNLAIALLQQSKWDPAELALKKCVALCDALKDAPRPQGSAANPYAEMAQRVQSIQGKIPAFRLRTEGDKASAAKNYDEAIAKYTEALKYEQNDPDLYYNLGLAQANGHHYEEALQSADKAIQMKPGEAAYRELKKKIAEFQQNAILIKAKGILEEGDKLYQAGDYAGAIKKYDEALPSVPEKSQGPIWAQKARSYAKLKQGDKAVECFKKAIAVAPDKPDYPRALAQYYMDEKRYEDALNVYAEAGAAGSSSPEKALMDLGQKLSSQGNTEVAELAYEKVLKMKPDYAEAYYELGVILYYSKQNDKRARELLTKYTETGTNADHKSNADGMLKVIKRRSP